MPSKFYGLINELKHEVDCTHFGGDWSVIGGKHVFTTYEGAILNWWSGTGTINFQGDKKSADYFKSVFEQFVLGKEKFSSSVRRHIKWHRFRPGLRETLLTSLVDIKRRLCGIASA